MNITKQSWLGLVASVLILGASAPQARSASVPRGKALQVVATTPGLAELTRQVGGARVSVKALTKGTENMHSVVVTPRMMVSLKKADVLVQCGLSLEVSWLPALVLKTRNAAIGAGGLGLITASDGWAAIAVPVNLSRQQGDVHPQGNPHFLTHPDAGPHVVERIREGLTRVDPGGAEAYSAGAGKALARMAVARERWEELRDKLRGASVVVYHSEFDYLLQWLGVNVIGTIESRPGIPPSPSHLARLVTTARAQDVGAVLTARWSNSRQVRKTAKDLGVPVIELPSAVGGEPWATEWIAWVDGLILRLDAALYEPEESEAE